MRLGSFRMEAVERSLDGLALRTEALAANVANVHTPGYVKQAVEFEQSLQEALEVASRPPAASNEIGVTEPTADVLLTWQPKMAKDSASSAQRLDGNTTPVETEMSTLAHNGIKYNAVAVALQKEFQLLKAISQAK